MKNIRKNSMTGIMETEGLSNVSLHFSEWWNGEGMDFTFDANKRITLHVDEIHVLVVSALAAGYIDMDAVNLDVESMNMESRNREQMLQRIRNKYDGKEC